MIVNIQSSRIGIPGISAPELEELIVCMQSMEYPKIKHAAMEATLEKMNPTRVAMLNMTILVGFYVSEAFKCAPGLLFDMLELKAQQNRYKRGILVRIKEII